MSLLTQFLPKKDTEEYYLILSVGDHLLRAIVVHNKKGDFQVVGQGESLITKDIEDSEAADTAISEAEKSLPKEILIQDTIFALSHHQLDGKEIKTEYHARLKKILKDLELKPKGFIEYASAISVQLENEEGSPPTLIILFLEASSLSFSLMRIGKIHKQLDIPRTSSLAHDFSSILPQFASEILPSRILLFSDETPPLEARDELLRFPWHKHTSFLHTPKIEVFPLERATEALLETLRTTLFDENPSSDLHTQERSIDEEDLPSNDNTIPDETFGFVKDADIAVHHPRAAHHPHPVHQDSPHQKDHASAPKHQEEEGEIHEHHHAKVPADHSHNHAGVRILLRIPRVRLPSLSWPSWSYSKIPIVVLFVLIAGILGGSSYYLVWHYPKATVSLVLYSAKGNEKTKVLFVSSDSEESSILTITTQTVTQEVKGEKTKKATGTTNIGEKAHGEVIVYNKSSASKTFPKGTILLSGKLGFAFDNEFSVASASDTGEGITFGKTTQAVSSSSIGPEGNMKEGTSFTIKDFPDSSYSAKSSQAFTGGTSRQIQSVSAKDEEDAKQELTQELTKQAKQQMAEQLSPGQKLIDGSFKSNVVSQKFSKKAGEEAPDTMLSLVLMVTALSFHEDELKKLAPNQQVPSGFILDDSRIGVTIEKITSDKDGRMEADVNVSLFYIPMLDENEIKQNLLGKTFDEAVLYVKTIPTVGGIKITEERTSPLTKDRLPRDPSQLTIQKIVH